MHVCDCLPGSKGIFKSELDGVVRMFTVLSCPVKLGRTFPCDRGLALPASAETSVPLLALEDSRGVLGGARSHGAPWMELHRHDCRSFMGGMTKSPPLQPKLLDGDIALIHFWILKRIAGHINAARKRAALLIH